MADHVEHAPPPTLASIVARAESDINSAARETALNSPRAMNAWDGAKRAIAELKAAARIIDEVARG